MEGDLCRLEWGSPKALTSAAASDMNKKLQAVSQRPASGLHTPAQQSEAQRRKDTPAPAAVAQ